MTAERKLHCKLLEIGATLSTAESCSGGTISSRLVAFDGASAYFLAGVVSYSNDAKINILGVDRSAIDEFGAVSQEVALQMAEGVRHISGSDYSIATTGIAGPSGGTPQKPVGTVWIAIATPHGNLAQLHNCGSERSQVIDTAATYGIEMLLRALDKL